MKKVLLVEDDQFLNDLYRQALSQAGYQVVAVRDAQAALDSLDRQGADLIVLDVFLPINNAFEIIQQLQSYGDWQGLPVILISSQPLSQSGLAPDLQRQLAVSRFLYKPQTLPRDLVSAVRDAI